MCGEGPTVHASVFHYQIKLHGEVLESPGGGEPEVTVGPCHMSLIEGDIGTTRGGQVRQKGDEVNGCGRWKEKRR